MLLEGKSLVAWSLASVISFFSSVGVATVAADPGAVTQGVFWAAFVGAALAGLRTVEEMRVAEPRRSVEAIALRTVITISSGCVVGVLGGEAALTVVLPQVDTAAFSGPLTAVLLGMLGEKVLGKLWKLSGGGA